MGLPAAGRQAKDTRPLWGYGVQGHDDAGSVCRGSARAGVTGVTGTARRDDHPSGMIDRDNDSLRGAARDASADFMAVFGGNDNRYTVADCTSAPCRLKDYSYGNRGGMPIVQRNVLPIDRGAGGTDGFGGAGLVVTVRRRVFGGDGKASRVARDLEAVAAVGADIDFLRGIG